MAEKNIIMQRKTATGFDKYYPKTKVENVEGAAKQSDLDAHLADYVRQPGYANATGTNAKTITLNPAPGAYIDGMAISFKNATQNTGAVTLNVNGLGAKSVVKPNGSVLKSGNLKANSVYTVRYNGTNFILQGEGGEYGTATASDVLSGKTIGTENGLVTGTMPNRGAVVITPGTSNKAIVAGYHNGNGYVKGDANLVRDNIVKGISIFGVTGSAKKVVTGSFSIRDEDIDIQLGFKPKLVLCCEDGEDYTYWAMAFLDQNGEFQNYYYPGYLRIIAIGDTYFTIRFRQTPTIYGTYWTFEY